MPRAVSPAGSRSAPDRPLAGVRHVKILAVWVREDRPSTGEVGNPCGGCGSASTITAWAILLTTASIPTPIRECALPAFPGLVALRLAVVFTP